MERGYLKLWRKSLDSEVFASEQLWILWTWCLMKASHKKRFVKFNSGKGGLSICVLPGQFVFGRNKAAEVFGWSPSTAWNRMQKLSEIGCIIIESNKQYSIVSICNWKIYQADDEAKLTSNGQATDKQLTSNGQATDTNKNVKNVENVENGKEDTTEQPKGGYSSRFETFWEKYPKKLGKAKAYTYWKKHKCDNGTFETIMESLEAQKQSKDWIKDNGQYIPHGSTWVGGRRWEDKPETTQPKQDPTYGTGRRIL